MRVSAAITVAALMVGACGGGPTRVIDYAAEDEKAHWKELPVKFPPPPRSENLVRFSVGDASPHRFYIDSPSLAIGADGVVRYTLVTRAAGGATNVTYEGIRCDGRRHKYYAVGETNGQWTPARNTRWRRIEMQDPDRQRLALVDTYLCQGNMVRSDREAVLWRLKQGPPEYEIFGPPDRPFQ